VNRERERQLLEKLQAIAKMATMGISAEAIAEILRLDVDLVGSELAKPRSPAPGAS
jgi:hypothetical protein